MRTVPRAAPGWHDLPRTKASVCTQRGCQHNAPVFGRSGHKHTHPAQRRARGRAGPSVLRMTRPVHLRRQRSCIPPSFFIHRRDDHSARHLFIPPISHLAQSHWSLAQQPLKHRSHYHPRRSFDPHDLRARSGTLEFIHPSSTPLHSGVSRCCGRHILLPPPQSFSVPSLPARNGSSVGAQPHPLAAW